MLAEVTICAMIRYTITIIQQSLYYVPASSFKHSNIDIFIQQPNMAFKIYHIIYFESHFVQIIK